MTLTVMRGREVISAGRFSSASDAYARLEDLVDRVNRAGCAAIAGGDGDQSVQERIRRRARFRTGAQFGSSTLDAIDGLASREGRQNLRGP